jgi:hypothetical protein
MGELANPRYEHFAQELAAGNTADGAYEAAGYRKHRGNAARLSANERIKDRVREIQAIGAERAAVTVQSLIDDRRGSRPWSRPGVVLIDLFVPQAGELFQYERIERVIVDHTSGDAAQLLSDDTVRNETTTKVASDRRPPTRPGSWSA